MTNHDNIVATTMKTLDSGTNSERYHGIDLVKFLLVFIVVARHTTDWNLGGMAAFPVYFLASGFFLFRKVFKKEKNDALRYIKKWIGNSFKLYLFWSIIYLPFAIYGDVQESIPAIKAIVIWFRNFIFVGENYLSWPLWYLLGMVWGGVFIYLLVWADSPFWLMCSMALCLFVFPYFINIYQTFPHYSLFFSTTRNGVFLGFPYMVAGGLFARYNIRIHLFLSVLLFAISFTILQYFPSATWLTALSVFLLALSWKGGPEDKISIKFSNACKSIYLSHMVFAGIFLIFFGMAHGTVKFILVSLCSLSFAILVSCLERNKRAHKITKYL